MSVAGIEGTNSNTQLERVIRKLSQHLHPLKTFSTYTNRGIESLKF